MSQITKNKRISIVVPAYDCEDVINSCISNIIQHAQQTSFEFEILVVIDGEDRKIEQEVRKINSNNVKIFHLAKNQGKGFAVKLGMINSTGDYIGYIDGGSDIDEKYLFEAFELIHKEQIDIVCGSKLHKDSEVLNYSSIRKFYTRSYNLLVKLLLGVDYQDTQVGLKVYSKRFVDEVMPRILVKRFAFEVETLAVGALFGFDKHKDVPVKIIFKDQSSATRLQSIVRMIWDTVAVFYRIKILKYYQKISKENTNKNVERQVKQLIFL